MARVRRDQYLEFWRLIRAGMSAGDASACLGFGKGTGTRWFRHAGGMPPMSLAEPATKPRRLTIEEREEILAGMHRDESARMIGDRIGRHHSTVSREINKNLRHQRYPRRSGGPGRPMTKPWNYSPHHAQLRADENAKRPKQAKLTTNLVLRKQVQDRLEHDHSPEQIAKRLVEDFPEDAEMRVSHETIYQSLYVQGRGALRRDLAKHLRTGRALRKPRRAGGERRSRIKEMVSICARPAEVADRAVPGHWEGDLIVGKHSASAIGTLVERTSRFTLLLHLPGNHGALAVQEAMVAKMSQLPQILRQSLTRDQGNEMARHVQIAAATDLEIYFCDPHSPWQRGTNENTNGLLRQHFPKGTDLSVHGAGYLDYIATDSTTDPAKPSTGKPQPRPSTCYSHSHSIHPVSR